MIGKLLSHILGNMEADGDNSVHTENGEDLLEYDDGEWIIINIHEGQPLSSSEVDPLENLLIEHPSMSVYKIMSPSTEEEEGLSSDEDEDYPRLVPFKHHLSWRLAGWGSPLPCSASVLPIQSGKTQMDRRKLSRSALQRQNLARIRFSPAERRCGFFKQPCQRLYNY